METTILTNEKIVNEEQLTLKDESISYLRTVSCWSKFFAVLGFVCSGLLIVMGIFSGFFFSILGGLHLSSFIGVIYVILGFIYFFPSLYLLGFATNSKKAVIANDSDYLKIALKNLKSSCQFMGILTIICIALYPVIMVIYFFFYFKSGIGFT